MNKESIGRSYKETAEKATKAMFLRRANYDGGFSKKGLAMLRSVAGDLVTMAVESQSGYADDWLAVAKEHDAQGTYRKIGAFIGPVEGTLLDVGCGAGHLLKYSDAPHAVGMDINPFALLHAERLLRGVPPIIGTPSFLYHPDTGYSLGGLLHEMPKTEDGVMLAVDDARQMLVTVPLLLRLGAPVSVAVFSLWGGVTSYLSVEILQMLKERMSAEGWKKCLEETMQKADHISGALRRLTPLLRPGSRIIFAVRMGDIAFGKTLDEERKRELEKAARPPEGSSWKEFIESSGVKARESRHEVIAGLNEPSLGIGWFIGKDKIRPDMVGDMRIHLMEFVCESEEPGREAESSVGYYTAQAQIDIVSEQRERSASESAEGGYTIAFTAERMPIDEVKTALEKSSPYARPFLMAVRLLQLLKEKERSAAHEYFREIVSAGDERMPTSALPYYVMGLYFAETNEERARYFEKAVELNERFEEALISLGTMYNRLGRYQDAVRVFDRLLFTISPVSSSVWYSRAKSVRDYGDAEEARMCFRAAYLLRPQWAPCLIALAHVEARLGCREEARAWIAKAMAEPLDEIVLYELGRFGKEHGESAYIAELCVKSPDADSIWLRLLRALALSECEGERNKEKSSYLMEKIMRRATQDDVKVIQAVMKVIMR